MIFTTHYWRQYFSTTIRSTIVVFDQLLYAFIGISYNINIHCDFLFKNNDNGNGNKDLRSVVSGH